MKMKITLLFSLLLLMISCRVTKLGQFYFSENHLKPKYPDNEIVIDENNVFSFAKGNEKDWKTIEQLKYQPNAYKDPNSKIYNLDEYLDTKTKTTAFLVIRNDSILFENYYEGYDAQSILPSFSVAKSFTSALVGIAIQEQLIKSEHDLVIDYLPELKNEHPYWQQLTILHLLNMRSGIDFNENSYVNPYSGISSLYITKDVMKFVKKAKFNHLPGQAHYYSSLDTEILGLVLEKATNKSLAKYLEEKIWMPCGMESPAKWSIDSKKHQHTKAFCCLQMVARDYAKFGRLYLNKGKYGSQQIINEDWVNKSTLPNFDNNCYQLQWYSDVKGTKGQFDDNGNYEIQFYPDSLSALADIQNSTYEGVAKHRTDASKWLIKRCGPEFFALGIFGQEIFVNPDKQLIFVRLGKKWDTSNRNIFHLITKALD